MENYWSLILFLETRLKKFSKQEALEQNVEAEATERQFILIYFITNLLSQSTLDVITDGHKKDFPVRPVCLRWLQKQRQKQVSNLSH